MCIGIFELELVTVGAEVVERCFVPVDIQHQQADPRESLAQLNASIIALSVDEGENARKIARVLGCAATELDLFGT